MTLKPSTLLLSALALVAATAACEKASPARPTDQQAAEASREAVTDARTGVTIVAGAPIAPVANAQIAWGNQPITLSVSSAVSTGKTALSYTYEVATDGGFTSLVYSKAGVTTTSQALDKLPGSKTYYWRVKVLSGATAGPASVVRSFVVGPEVILGTPSPLSPANGGTAFTPLVLTTTNISRTGPAGPISYRFDVSASQTDFSAPLFSTTTAEGGNNQTSVTAAGTFTSGTTYFWRVQASDPANGLTTAFSPVFAFQAQSFNWAAVTMHASPPDLPFWPEAAHITSIEFTDNSFRVEFDRRTGPNKWPEVVPPGWSGGLQYTLGMCFDIAGGWHCSAPIQFWDGRSLDDSAPPWDVALEWFYDARWGIMQGHQPQVGELVGIFVGSGDLRGGSFTQASCPRVCERSQVVLFNWPGAPVFMPFSSPIRSILRTP